MKTSIATVALAFVHLFLLASQANCDMTLTSRTQANGISSLLTVYVSKDRMRIGSDDLVLQEITDTSKRVIIVLDPWVKTYTVINVPKTSTFPGLWIHTLQGATVVKLKGAIEYLGHTCHQYVVSKHFSNPNEMTVEYTILAADDLAGPDAQTLTESLGLSRSPTQIVGIPLVITFKETLMGDSKPVIIELLRVTAISTVPVPEDEFGIPSGYKLANN